MSEETAEPGFVDSKCPHCGAEISFPEAQIGLAQDCPICMKTIIVPEAGTEVARTLPLPIQTPRLILRRYNREDWKDVLEFMSDEKLFEFMNWLPCDEEEVVRWLEADRIARLTDEHRTLSLGIELTSSRKIIGSVAAFYRDDGRLQAGFNVIVNRNYQRKGYGTEAARGILDFWFRGLNLHRVWAACDSRNTIACAMLARAGLRREGECIQDSLVFGEWVSTVYFALLRDEFAP